MKFTKATIARLVYQKSGRAAHYRWEASTPGFGVRVYPPNPRTGQSRKAFVIAYRNAGGRKRFLTLGDFPKLDVIAARRTALDLFTQIRAGNDPQQNRAEKRQELSFRDYSRSYIADAKHRKRSWHDDEQRLRDHILPDLGPLKLSEITPRQIRHLHIALKERRSPATANRVLALIKHILNTAIRDGLLRESPAKHVSMFREPPGRDIVLSRDDCQRLLDACDAESNVFARALFKSLMFTGRRVGELLGAKWNDLDLERGILTLPMTKAGERQHVILSEAAASVLTALPKVDGNPHIFAGDADGKPIQTYWKAWLRILKQAGMSPFPVHGLRHNFASTLVAGGVPLEQVGHLLGHKSVITTRRYAHHRPDDLRRAANAFSTALQPITP